MAGVGGTSLGPGSPTPVSSGYRQASVGKPSLSYNAKGGEIESTVGQGKGGSPLGASFAPRAPLHPPGVPGVGERGSFVDARA